MYKCIGAGTVPYLTDVAGSTVDLLHTPGAVKHGRSDKNPGYLKLLMVYHHTNT